jgi:hypothetical protein
MARRSLPAIEMASGAARCRIVRNAALQEAAFEHNTPASGVVTINGKRAADFDFRCVMAMLKVQRHSCSGPNSKPTIQPRGLNPCREKHEPTRW